MGAPPSGERRRAFGKQLLVGIHRVLHGLCGRLLGDLLLYPPLSGDEGQRLFRKEPRGHGVRLRRHQRQLGKRARGRGANGEFHGGGSVFRPSRLLLLDADHEKEIKDRQDMQEMYIGLVKKAGNTEQPKGDEPEKPKSLLEIAQEIEAQNKKS